MTEEGELESLQVVTASISSTDCVAKDGKHHRVGLFLPH